METLELIVYVILALIVGGFVLSVTMDFGEKSIKTKESEQFKYTKEEFIHKIPELWEDCGLGSFDRNYSMYVSGEGNISEDEIFEYVEKYNYDDVLLRKDLNITDTELPSILRVMCISDSMTIEGTD